MAFGLLKGSVALHVDAPPLGSVVLNISPILKSAATHRPVEGQLTAAIPGEAADTTPLFQAPIPPVGSVEVRIFAALSTATHKLVVGQDTPVNESAPLRSMPGVVLHAPAPPVGLLEV
jgi:hypothetical protein